MTKNTTQTKIAKCYMSPDTVERAVRRADTIIEAAMTHGLWSNVTEDIRGLLVAAGIANTMSESELWDRGVPIGRQRAAAHLAFWRAVRSAANARQLNGWRKISSKTARRKSALG